MIKTQLIKSELVKNQMTQLDLAKKIGMGTTSLSLKLNNKREFTVREIIGIANVLNVDVNIFLSQM